MGESGTEHTHRRAAMHSSAGGRCIHQFANGRRPDYRKVAPALLHTLSHQDPDLILVCVRPAPGYAKVRVNSERRGLSTQLLDWRTIAPCDRPPPIKWGYPPGVGIVEPEEGKSYAA